MGMFDTLICNVEETREHWGLTFQTKDLDQSLGMYKLTSDGLYKLKNYDEPGELKSKSESQQKEFKQDYTGKLRFYTYDDNAKWVEYWALLDEGEVLWIKKKKG